MFADTQSTEYLKIPFSSPKLAMSSSFKIPSTPIKSGEQPAPWMTPDYNLRLLVNSVLSSPVSRNHTLLSSTSEETIAAVERQIEISQMIMDKSPSLPKSILNEVEMHRSGGNSGKRTRNVVRGRDRHGQLTKEENESNHEFKKRRNRLNQQRSRAKRKHLVSDLEQEIAALKETLAEKDKIIAKLLLK